MMGKVGFIFLLLLHVYGLEGGTSENCLNMDPR